MTLIDYSIDGLAADCWQFFSGNDESKVINKEAFMSEVKSVLTMLSNKKDEEIKALELRLIEANRIALEIEKHIL